MTTKKRTPKAPSAIVAYKGLDADFKCRGYRYEVGKSYTHEGPVKKCESGFHACEYPLDIFGYYAPAHYGRVNRFARVALSGELSRDDFDSKIAAAKITINAEIHIPDLVAATFQHILSRARKIKKRHATRGRSTSLVTGDYSASLVTGDYSASSVTGYQSVSSVTGTQSASSATGYQSASSVTGYRSASSATGDSSVSSATGNQSASSATGYQSASSATGDFSASSATGDRSTSVATGYSSVSSATGDFSVSSATGQQSASSATGDRSASSATGYQSAALTTGNCGTAQIENRHNGNIHAVAIAIGYQSRAKASVGSAIVCVYRNKEGELLHIRAGIAGKDIEPNTWYTLEADGHFVKVPT